jgi:hypothetical protein
MTRQRESSMSFPSTKTVFVSGKGNGYPGNFEQWDPHPRRDLWKE